MVEPLINQIQHRKDKIKAGLELFPIVEADKRDDGEYLKDRLLIRRNFP
jgi:hypothetical protein